MSKYGLLIGINYFNTKYQLGGCINDIIQVRKYLLNTRQYKSENLVVLRDDNAKFAKPDSFNIISELVKLVDKANKDLTTQEVFIHYSGHGSFINDSNGDEIDRKDEVLVPSDFRLITDDILRSLLKNLRNNIKCYILSDCCHSATNVDLPYVYSVSNNKITLVQNNSTKYRDMLNKNILQISGCLDAQFAADASGVYQADQTGEQDWMILPTNRMGGALTSTLLNTLASNQTFTLENVLPNLQTNVRRQGFTQLPQVSCGYDLVASLNKKRSPPKDPKKKKNSKLAGKKIVKL